MAIKPKGKKVTGTKKKDKITWTNSKPWKTNLTVKAGAGNDVINFSKSSSKYKHKIYGEAGNDVIKGGKGKDTIDGGTGNDKIYGNAGNDVLKAGKGNDYIDGGAGNDKIYGQYGTNKLKGGTGKDIIYAGTGTDNIWGGKDDDIIYANKGVNVVNISKGDGNDKIRGVASSKKLTLNLGTGLANVIAYKSGSNVVFERKYSDTYSEYTTLENFNYDTTKDKVFVNYNGKSVSLSSVYIPNYDPANSVFKELGDEGGSYNASSSSKNQIVYGGAGADTISTMASDDYINAGEGNNKISTDGGSNTVITGSGNDTITIGSENQGTNNIESAGGNNEIETHGGNTITLGAGNDLVTVRGGSAESKNSIDVGAGDNHVEVRSLGESTITGSGDDTIDVWSGTNHINVGSGEDYIYLNGGTNTVDLRDADGTGIIVYEGSSENTIYGGAGNNSYRFDGGSTNLIIDDHEGQSQYSIGGGSVTISGNSDDVDKVTITGGANHDIKTGGGNDSITINYASGVVVDTGADADKVTISSGASNTTVKTGDGNDRIDVYGSDSKIYGGKGYDYIDVSASNGANTIYGGNDSLGTDSNYNIIHAENRYDNVIYAGNGIDTVDGEGNSYRQGDEIYAGNSGQGNNKIYGGKGNDSIDARYSYNATIDGGEGDDYILTAQNLNSIAGGKGNDSIDVNGYVNTINGGEGNDSITLASRSSATADITGGVGNDTINVSSSGINAIMHFKKGDGYDSIKGGWAKSDSHTLVFDDVNKDEIYTSVKDNHLTITYGYGNDSVYVENFANNYTNTAYNSVKYIKTADMAEAMSLEDFVNQRSIFNVTPENLTESGYYDGTSFSDQITGTSGDDSIYGNSGNDTIIGGQGNDTLYGDYGNDSLVGGEGADYLEDYYGENTMVGGAGNDELHAGVSDSSTDHNTMLFYKGDGVDTVTYAGNYATLKFEANSINDIILEYDLENQAVAIKYTDTDKVIIQQNNNNGNYHDEYNINIGLIGSDTTRSLQQLMDQRHIYMPTLYNYSEMEGTSANEQFYVADAYQTVVTGGGGDDTITLLGDIDEYGDIEDVTTVSYVFNSYGDGQDVIEAKSTRGSSYIVFKGVGSNYDDNDSQSDFLNSLKYTTNESGDLVITYGSNNSTITIKGYNPADPQLNIQGIRFSYYDYETENTYYSSTYYFGDYMHITRNEDGSETSIQGADYNELIYGSTGDDTINPGIGQNIVDPKSGADTIEFTKHFDSEGNIIETETTLDMGSDNLPDTIWFKGFDTTYIDTYDNNSVKENTLEHIKGNELSFGQDGNDLYIINTTGFITMNLHIMTDIWQIRYV